MPEDLVVNSHIRIPREEFSFSFVRSSGPGGQNVNKVNTKAVLRWPVADSPSLPDDVRRRLTAKFHRRISGEGEMIITSQRYRDQHRNVGDCLEKLAVMVRTAAVRPKKRKATRPTKAAQRRRLQEKRKTSERKRQRGAPRMDD